MEETLLQSYPPAVARDVHPEQYQSLMQPLEASFHDHTVSIFASAWSDGSLIEDFVETRKKCQFHLLPTVNTLCNTLSSKRSISPVFVCRKQMA